MTQDDHTQTNRQRHISMELTGDEARVTNLSLRGNKLVVTIEAELAGSLVNAAGDLARHFPSGAEVPGSSAARPKDGVPRQAPAPAPVPLPPQSALAPAVGLAKAPDASPVSWAPGALGSEQLPPASAPAAKAVAPAPKPAAPVEKPRPAPAPVAPAAAGVMPAPMSELRLDNSPSIHLDPFIPSAIVTEETQSQNEPDADATVPIPGYGMPANPPASASAKELLLGDDAFAVDPFAAAPAAAVPPAPPVPSLTLGDDIPAAAPFRSAAPAAPAPAPAAAPSLSLGDDFPAPAPFRSAAPVAPAAAPQAAAPGLRLGGDDVLSPASWGGISPMTVEATEPMMETWHHDPSLPLPGAAPIPAAPLAMSEDSSALGGQRHGEPQPAISFGFADAASAPHAPAAAPLAMPAQEAGSQNQEDMPTQLAMPTPPMPEVAQPQPKQEEAPQPEGKSEAGGTTVLIRYTCPKCKTQGMQAVDKVGTVVNCSNCGKAMRLVMRK